MDYHQRLRPVIHHLERHYAQNFNLENMAALAHLSPYHFHRIFKAVTGETPAEYLRRLRLENIARCLFYDKNARITALALEHGFSSSQALAKAFRQHFGLTPSAIRACDNLEALITTMHNSKIGHLLRKPGHAPSATNADTAPAANGSDTHRKLTMKIEQHPARTLAYIRVTGPYGKNYEPATSRLYQWANLHGLADGECLYIYWDNPETTPDDKCRTDICLSVPAGTQTDGEIETQHLEGGRYAVIRRTVTDPKQYSEYWQELITAIIEHKLALDDSRPCFEHYHHYDNASGKADVSFCAAVSA